jgi:hypothetical protein
MNRIGILALTLLLANSAFAQQGGPRDLAGPSDTAEKQQGQLQRSITNFYFVNLKNEVELTDDQIVKAQGIIANFIRMRFQNATQRTALDGRQKELLSRPDASQADFQKLNEEVAKLASDNGTWETRLVNRLQTALGDQQLSDRQITALRNYNRTFFEERLPMLVDRARGNLPPRGQQQRGTGTAGRPNQPNRKDQPGGPANTLRPGTDVQPVPPRPKSGR